MVRKVLVQAAPEEDIESCVPGFGEIIAVLADAVADVQRTFIEAMALCEQPVPEVSRLALYGV